MNFLKRVALLVTLFLIMAASALVYAKITHTLLVFDSGNQAQLPERFRTSNDALPDNIKLSKEGLATLHIAGSRQFSEKSLIAALNKIPARDVVVVDLRRESHGLLNGHAVSWYGPQNAANEDKTETQIHAGELRLLARLQKSHYRWVYQIIEKTKDDYVDKTKRDFVLVDKVRGEQALVVANKLGYERFYVEDFHAPDDASVDRFVGFAKTVPATTWLYFHCRAGRGRTTTFMAMYDMFKNAKTLSFDEIIKRQAALGGTNLDQLPDKGSFKYRFAEDRLAFLRGFYQYIKENNDDYSTRWTEWRNRLS